MTTINIWQAHPRQPNLTGRGCALSSCGWLKVQKVPSAWAFTPPPSPHRGEPVRPLGEVWHLVILMRITPNERNTCERKVVGKIMCRGGPLCVLHGIGRLHDGTQAAGLSGCCLVINEVGRPCMFVLLQKGSSTSLQFS